MPQDLMFKTEAGVQRSVQMRETLPGTGRNVLMHIPAGIYREEVPAAFATPLIGLAME